MERNFEFRNSLSTPIDAWPSSWEAIEWKDIRARLYEAQGTIYKLRQRGKLDAMHRLQLKICTSVEGRLLAVRRVAQDNQGKATAGTDGVARLTPDARFALAQSLTLTGISGPIRRVWIPKPGTDEQRPLGIPNMVDRATQALVKMALEPEHEAIFEPNSYGFRPGRSVPDAIKQLKNSVLHSRKCVYDADLEKCLDRISHKALLGKLTQPIGSPIYNQVEAWLQAGVVEGFGSPFAPPTIMGTPQGGVISPLLANIALHGLENSIKCAVFQKCVNRKKMMDQTKVIRYADDFVVLAPDPQVLAVAIAAAQEFVAGVGLNVKESKTRITDTEAGFNFLGFEIRQIQVGIHRASKASGGRKTDYVVRIIPTKKNVDKHFSAIRQAVKKSTTPGELIAKVNRIIQGYVNFARYSDATTWGRTAEWSRRLYLIISNWVKRTYKTRKRIDKVWTSQGSRNWVLFGQVSETKKKTLKLVYLKDYYNEYITYSINSYVKVTGDRSPFDGDWVYWGTRVCNNQQLSDLTLRLLKRQRGKCSWCGQYFGPNDIHHKDHKVPKSRGGKNNIENLQLLHIECHNEKTRNDHNH